MLRLIHKIEPVSNLWMSRSVFFLGNPHNTPSVIRPLAALACNLFCARTLNQRQKNQGKHGPLETEADASIELRSWSWTSLGCLLSPVSWIFSKKTRTAKHKYPVLLRYRMLKRSLWSNFEPKTKHTSYVYWKGLSQKRDRPEMCHTYTLTSFHSKQKKHPRDWRKPHQ